MKQVQLQELKTGDVFIFPSDILWEECFIIVHRQVGCSCTFVLLSSSGNGKVETITFYYPLGTVIKLNESVAAEEDEQ